MYVNLTVVNDADTIVEVEMEGAKTIRYAAKTMAEHLGLGADDADWRLKEASTDRAIDENDLAADWDGQEVVLGLTYNEVGP